MIEDGNCRHPWRDHHWSGTFCRMEEIYRNGTESSNPTLGSSGFLKKTRDSSIQGERTNAFCVPDFVPEGRHKRPWMVRTRRARATIHPSPANLAVATDAGQRLRKPCRNPGHLRYPRLHPTCSQAACQGRARAPQSTMTKVGKSHSKGTFAGAFGNDEDVTNPVIPRDCEPSVGFVV